MASRRKLLGGKPRSWWLWTGYWCALFVVMHVPITRAPHLPFEQGDKLIHFVLYFLLAWLGGRHLRARGHSLRVSSILVWTVVYAIYGALDEWLQSFVGRTMSFGDWLADLGGIVAAAVVLMAWPVRAPLSEPTAPER